ncbi:MAG: carbohydrate-binding protein, partial [Draconibacterium sp.]
MKLQPFLTKAAAFIFVGFMLPFYAISQEYSFEAEDANLSNGATIQNAAACSGGKQVGNLGGTQNGSVTKVFQVTSGGNYDLSVSYCSADQRSFSVRVNYGNRIELVCPSSGDWSQPSTVKLQIFLVSGQNVLVFDNPDNWAPNLDKFSLELSPSYNISGKLEENGVGVSGAVLSLSGAKTKTVVSDEAGNYSFTGLTGGNTYTITPEKEGLVFYPPYLLYEPLTEEKTEQNFRAEPVCSSCVEQLSFGSNGKLEYSAQTGTFSVFSGSLKIISSAYSEVKSGTIKISSMDYSDRQVAIEDITDDFGVGKKLTVSLSAEDLPEMQQIFYAYAGKEYLLTEVVLKGDNISSDYMAPIVSNKVDIGEQGDNRLLFVPFDNDGFVRYKSNAMDNFSETTSSEVTAFYDNNSRKGMVVGSVEQLIWKTGIKGSGQGNELSSLVVFGGYTKASVTRDRKEHGTISGNELKSPKVFVGYFNDWRDGLEEYGWAVATSQPRYVFDWDKPTPFGWNSWGAIQTNLNLTNATAVVDFFDKD